MKIGHNQSKDELREGSACIGLTLTIGSFKHSIVHSPNRFSPLVHIVHSAKMDLFEVFEEINHCSGPFVGVGFIIVVVGSNLDHHSSVENHVSSTGPTTKLFMDTMKLKKGLVRKNPYCLQ